MGSSGRTFDAVTNPSSDMLMSKITLLIRPPAEWGLSLRLHAGILRAVPYEHTIDSGFCEKSSGMVGVGLAGRTTMPQHEWSYLCHPISENPLKANFGEFFYQALR